jgi:RNA polymerase sigma-70 factor, ECF subfamily
MVNPAEVPTAPELLTDEEVVARVLAGETGMFEIVMRRHNQRLYRVARAILRNDGEAEDVMQDAYVRAYEHLDQFAGRARFSTWLTRIAVHEALARQRRGNRHQELEPMSEREGDPMDRFASLAQDPEQQASNSEIRTLLEQAIEKLPDAYRTIFMLRDVEDLSTTDAAEVLEITEDNVKVRLHRARVVAQESLRACWNGKERGIQFSCPAVRSSCEERIRKNSEARHESGALHGEDTVTVRTVQEDRAAALRESAAHRFCQLGPPGCFGGNVSDRGRCNLDQFCRNLRSTVGSRDEYLSSANLRISVVTAMEKTRSAAGMSTHQHGWGRFGRNAEAADAKSYHR